MMTPKCLMDLSLNLICSLIFAKSVLGNSIDTSFPIVIHDKDEQLKMTSPQNAEKTGDTYNHNYFGYSLAFLKGYQSDSHSTLHADNRSTIFIGAPNETKYTSNSGVVWRCEFNGNENPPVRCSIQNRISEWFSTSHRFYSCAKKHDYFEKQTQQWIGGSLDIHPTSRELLACAPRWKLNDYNGCTGQEKMPGACYLASDAYSSILLNPLNNRREYSSDSTVLYRFAQFGFSSHFAESGQLIVGAPSTKRWTGAMIEVNQLTQRSDFLTVNNDFPEIRAGSLHGYAVTSGRTRSGGQYYASGAPRAMRLYGAVTITFPSNRKVYGIFEGEQFGSYFGYTLATLDLNGDGYDELLVGAPFYTPEVKSGQSMTIYNTGCVLIFNLAQLEYTSRPFKLCIDPQRVSSGSRFGSAITKIGRINFDEYEDFAISAPYDDNGEGTIFIYHGGFPLSNQPAQVIRGKSLNIENLRGFGTYLLGGTQVDIDGNGTPDLVVGAFQSRHVVILRTRPVARVHIKISYLVQNGNGHLTRIMRFSPTQTQPNLIVRACFRFQFSVDKIKIPSVQKLDTWLSFELGSKTKHVQFDDGTVDEQMYTLSASRTTCVDKRLTVVNMEEVSSGSNSSAIQVRARLKYSQTEASETQLIQHANVTLSSSPNQQSWNEYTRTYNSFNAYLPVPIPAMYSEWEQLPVAADNCESDGDPQCNAELKLQVKVFVEANAATQDRKEWKSGTHLTIGKFDSVVVQIELSNDNGTKAETAYNPELRITLGVSKTFNMEPNSLDTIWELSGKIGRCRNLDDTSEDTKVEEVATTTALFGQRCAQVVHPGRKIEYRVKIGNWGHLRVGNSSNKGFLTLEVEAFPQQNRNQSVQERIQMPLQADVNINVKSSVPPDQVEIDPGLARSGLVDISQYFIIRNNGSSGTTMEAVTAEILIPTHADLKGKKLTEVIGVADPSSLNIRCTSDLKFFVLPSQRREGQQNSSFSVENNDTLNSGTRSKRSIDRTEVSPEKVSVKKSNDKYVTLSGCEGNVQKSSCQKIVCKMDLLPRATAPREIRLQMYILENVLGELVTVETKGIRVTSVISVFYQGGKVIEENGVTQRNFTIVEGISALILLGAGAGGTILLILIAFLLLKCGFFRRKTKEDLKQLKRQTMLLDQNAFKQAQEGLQALMENDMHTEIAL